MRAFTTKKAGFVVKTIVGIMWTGRYSNKRAMFRKLKSPEMQPAPVEVVKNSSVAAENSD
jgi:hypothetical protein